MVEERVNDIALENQGESQWEGNMHILVGEKKHLSAASWIGLRCQ
jgi:hypothetical protein